MEERTCGNCGWWTELPPPAVDEGYCQASGRIIIDLISAMLHLKIGTGSLHCGCGFSTGRNWSCGSKWKKKDEPELKTHN